MQWTYSNPRPLRRLYEIALLVVAGVVYGWHGVVLVFLALLDLEVSSK